MTNYIVVHYNGNISDLTYKETEDEARSHLSHLITNNQVRKNDTLAIIRSCDDYLVYFNNRNHSLDSVLEKQSQSSLGWNEFWFRPMQEMVARLGKRLANLVVAEIR